MTCAAQGTPICMTCTLTPTAKFEVTASADVTFSGAMKNGIPARSRSDCTCRASARLQPSGANLGGEGLLREWSQLGALRDEKQQFLVAHLPIALGEAQKFSRWVESIHN